MTPEEALSVARSVAEKKGWPWQEPVLVEPHRPGLFGRRQWRVTTNTWYAEIGRNVHVRIDDKTGRVLSSDYTPGGVLSN